MKITNVHAKLLTLGVQRDGVERAVQVTLSAILRLISIETYCKRMKAEFDIQMNTAIFNEYFDKGYYQKNLKLYLTWCIAHDITCRVAQRRVGRQFGLAPIDRRVADLVPKVERRAAKERILPDAVLYDSPQAMDLAIETAVHDLKDHIGRFTNKKLVFTTKGTHQSKDDIHGDLKVAAIRAAYKTYPFQKSELHLINSMKSAIHNVGMNIIQSATTKSRQVMVREGDDFVMLREGFDFYGSHNDMASVVSSCGIDGGAGTAESECTTTDNIAYKQIVSQVKGRAAQFLVILAGHYSERFSRYLRSIGINKDNDEWSQVVLTGRRTSLQRYYEIIADYCKLQHAQAFQLLAAYRHQLAG